MSVRRRQRWLGSQRIDVPHLRSIESAVSADFDELLKGFVTGENNVYVVRGFEINMTGAIGAAASGLQMLVASSTLFHGSSRQSGTFYTVSSTATPEVLNSTINTKVRGAFTPNAVNYVGIEYERFADTATSDTVYFWNPTNKNEFSSNVPLANILRYNIVITTSVWANNVVPIAKVTVDVAGNVVDITDQRPMLFRLGTAGRTNPNPAYVYPWTNQTEGRLENPVTSTSNSVNPFRGGDKQIYNLKEWMDAVMSSFKEMKGTTFWYSQNVGGSLVKLRQDLGNTVITGRGQISHSSTVAGRINWDQAIQIALVSSRLSFQLNANPSSSDITLADDQAAYITLKRGVNIVPNLVFTNGSAIVTSVGAVSWTGPLQAGDWVKLATDDDTKYLKIQSVDSLSQVTLSVVYPYTSTGISGAKAQYALGVYETNPTPSTDRHIRVAARKDVPFTEDTFWFLLRSDNGGSLPRVYVRFLGSELEQGEDRDISDNTSKDIVTYIGSVSEVDNSPEYSNKLGALVSEVTDITVPAASAITSGQHMLIYSALDLNEYYIWFNRDNLGGNPNVVGKIPIEVAITTGDTANQVASALQTAINGVIDFNATVSGATVTVTNVDAGTTTNASNVNVNGATVTVTTQGTGASNNYISDGDNLTLAIKKLDKKLKELAGNEITIYEEVLTVVSGSPANDNEVTGPITSGTNLTLPYDSHFFNAVNGYIVGKADLEVYLNGQRLRLGADYTEVGANNTESVTIQIQQNLVVGDELLFRIDPGKAAAAGGGGSGEANTGANIGTGAAVFKNKTGVTLNFRRIQQGSGVTITENANDITISAAPSAPIYDVVTVNGTNYTATASNDYILVNNSGGNRTVTLPTAIGNSGKHITVKKLDTGNTLFVATVLNQTVDGVDRTSTPYSITTQYETISIISDGANWWIV
jgi:hypothetical protein